MPGSLAKSEAKSSGLWLQTGHLEHLGTHPARRLCVNQTDNSCLDTLSFHQPWWPVTNSQ